ncbi:MAG: DUF192 domain-containing protein [Dehalococcoidia bacterium]|nr:DUF192 domain-containing protein [Dehalococcoidia bacterium]
MPLLRNARTGETLATDLRTAHNFWQKFRGLMARPPLPEGGGLHITDCESIHSAFMRFSFDAAFLDKQGVVVHVIHAMRAWRASRFVWKASGVVELPAGVLLRTGTQVGDRLLFEG